MGLLKRLFGTTDALAEARADLAQDTERPPAPADWAAPTTREEGDTLILELPVPGLDPESVTTEIDGSNFRVRASASHEHGRVQQWFDETLDLPEGSDLSRVTADYVDGKFVIRIPKADIKPTQLSE